MQTHGGSHAKTEVRERTPRGRTTLEGLQTVGAKRVNRSRNYLDGRSPTTDDDTFGKCSTTRIVMNYLSSVNAAAVGLANSCFTRTPVHLDSFVLVLVRINCHDSLGAN